MTQQIIDSLIYRDKTYPMPDINELCLTKAPWFKRSEAPVVTCCWRGYVATWLIENDRLFLLELGGSLRPHAGDLQRIESDRSRLYPLRLVTDDAWEQQVGSEKPSFCDWYSGDVKVGIGPSTPCYVPIFETYMVFSIEEGLVKAMRFVAAEDLYAEEAARRPDMAICPRARANLCDQAPFSVRALRNLAHRSSLEENVSR
jgi:hypothetical protein